mgnify:FL=1
MTRKNHSIDNYPEIMSTKMVAEYLNIGYAKALRFVKSGEIPYIRIGHSYRVPKRGLLQYLEEGFRKVM